MLPENTLCLDELADAQSAIIIGIKTNGILKQKLFNMGFIPGVAVTMIRSAPLFDPLEIQLLDYLVTLRREEAHTIEVMHQ